MKRFIIITVVLMIMISITGSFGLPVDDVVLVKSYNIDGSNFLPLRFTFESLGYDVSWQESNRTVEITKDNHSVYVKADSIYAMRNGVLIKGDVEPVIQYGTMFVPVETMKDIFTTCIYVGDQTYRVREGLKELVGLPVLESKEDYQALLDFYPSQEMYYMHDDFLSIDFELPVLEEATADAPAAMEARDVSETNNQVDGVDEADLVKIDGDYIYALRQGNLQIIKTGRGALDIVYTLSEEGFYPNQLFITDSKLVLIGQENSTEMKTIEEGDRIISRPVYHNALMVKIYDKSDLGSGAPEFLKAFGVEGNYLSARLVDDYVYLVANNYNYYYEPWMPVILESTDDGLLENEVGYDELSYFPGHVNNSTLYTMGIDLNNLTKDGYDIDAYVGGGSTLYADMDTMYLAVQENSGMWWRGWSDNTEIFSFDLDKGQIDFKAKGKVEGYILNQFSMDEYDGYFRIATTAWRNLDKEGMTSVNNLYILNEELELVGARENLAPGERIYSSRMMGDKVYIVTFRQVDPFYVIDTSNPTEPLVLGYLKIPGYSSYLHPYDEKTIIGVGMETIEVDGWVRNDGVKISLFDVSDFANPIEKDKVILGTGNSSTEVSYDHKAFLFNNEKNILALPAYMANESNTSYSTNAYIFSFDEEGMLNFRGEITHSDLSAKGKLYYDYYDNITRILYVDDDLYTLSENWIKLNDFDTLDEVEYLER